jgi:polar amino acid transport system substrate-binding protein
LKMPDVEIDYRIQNAQIVGYETEDPAIEDLSLGDGVKLDAVMTILPIAKRAIDLGSPVKILGDPLFSSYASVTMDRSSNRDVVSLLNEINLVIQDLHKSSNNCLKNIMGKT